jgi:hypothetical protein
MVGHANGDVLSDISRGLILAKISSDVGRLSPHHFTAYTIYMLLAESVYGR